MLLSKLCILFFWLRLKKLGMGIYRDNSDGITDALSVLMPCFQEIFVPELAFDQEEKATLDGQHASSYVLQKILEYFGRYNGRSHLAPYTSIVGRSGLVNPTQ